MSLYAPLPGMKLLRRIPARSGRGFRAFPDDAIERSIPERFAEQVRAHADRLALRWPGGSHTYASLDDASNRLAGALLARSSDTTLPVALLFTHGGEALVAILAVLKAGKFYVVLDPAYPADRLRYMLADSGAKAMVSDADHRDQARALCGDAIELIPFAATEEDRPASAAAVRPGPDSLAMILYTSGSTGTPKAVMHTHRNVLADVRNLTNGWQVTAHDRWLLYASLSFANSVRTVYASLLNGAALFPFDFGQGGFAGLARWLTDNEITIIRGVPTFFRHFMAAVAADQAFPAVRILSLGGESMLRADLRYFNRHFAAHCVLSHAFGPTECLTVCWALIPHGEAAADGKLPIGSSLPGKDVLLLDESGHEVGAGEVGEIAVRSPYLSPGYWRDPERTAAAFRPDPAGGAARVYMTGDLGVRQPDGILIHVGRRDFQVKIRGFRIDVHEIENVLRAVPGLRDAIVVAREIVPGDPQLIAYFVASGDAPVSVAALRAAIARALPRHMMPAAFIAIDAVPLTPNGKTDRLRLPLPARDRRDSGGVRKPACTPLESALAAIWSEVLGLDDIGIDEPLLALGGDSVHAARIAARAAVAFGLDLPVGVAVEAGTVAQMAKAIAMARAAGGTSPPERSERVPGGSSNG